MSMLFRRGFSASAAARNAAKSVILILPLQTNEPELIIYYTSTFQAKRIRAFLKTPLEYIPKTNAIFSLTYLSTKALLAKSVSGILFLLCLPVGHT